MPGINEVPYLTNSSMMDVDFLPRHLIIVGGSYIGLEFGQMYRRFGSEVTIIEMAPRLVRHEDEDVSAAIKDIIELEGVDVRLNAECISLAKRGDEIIANVDCTAGAPKSLARICCWQSVVGRIPTISISTKPGCAATSVATSSSTTDCKPLRRASGPSATATARAPSPTPPTTISRSSPRICSTEIRAGSASVSPHMPFISTAIGSRRHDLGQARTSGRRVLAGERPMTRVARAVEKGETQGFMRILVDGDSKEILGASLLGTGCDEAVHAILDLMYAKAPYTVMQHAMHIHPTVSELLPTILGDLKSVG